MPSGVDWKIHTCLSPHPEFALHFSQLNMHEHAKVDTLYPTLYTHTFTQRIALTVCAACGRRSFGSGCLGLGCFGYLWMFSCYVMLSLECMESSQSSHVLTGFCAGVVLRGAMHGHGCMGWRDAAFGGQGPGWEGFCSG
jgi:hypothetical protein